MRIPSCLRVMPALLMTAALFAQDPRTLRPQQGTESPAPQESRIALVIGNGAYREAPLKNPAQDARAMAKALHECGFQVQMLIDASLPQMEAALRLFGQKLGAGGVGLFYFAGHGIQVKGANYLIPAGADIRAEDEVRFKALDASAVLAKMESAGNGLNLLVLDACRNNPFGRGWHRGGAEGLAQMDAPTGTYIAFATAPGRTASDGEGANGLYTQHLLEALQHPGLKVEEVFKRVRVGVRRSSRDQQVPWDSSSLTGDFYFRPGGAPAPQPAALPVQGPAAVPPTGADPLPGPPPSAPQELTGQLQVAVVGGEARIYLDGELKGTARPGQPLDLTALTPGESRLKAEAPGFMSVNQIIRVEAGRWRQVAVPMKRGLRVTVYRKPNLVQWKGVTFEVLVDDRKMAGIGNREYAQFEIPAGECRLRVVNPTDDMFLGKVETQVRLEDGPKTARFFRLNAGMSLVLTEVSEETWKRESASFGSTESTSARQP